ncbi:MAG: Jag N-terminal domain-containing protein [Candidatus Omnitrophica bacterium]|nr:Jag N-terminal domain-containing protein [Candidatus Omnitrophota bacterium]
MEKENIHKRHKLDQIEIEAKTAQEAIKIALSKLGVKRSEVDIRVLREENKGLFSMNGAKLAKVRIKKKLRK